MEVLVQELLEKARRTLGAAAELAAVQSVAGIADCQSPNGPYTTALQAARGDRLFFQQVHPGGRAFTGVVNGQVAWAVDAVTGEAQPLSPEATAMILGHDLLILPLILAERFHKLRPAGTAEYGGKLCQVLAGEDPWRSPCLLYFASDTGRLAGLALTNPIGAAGEMVQIVFKGWLPVGEVTLPAEVLITDKTGEFYFRFRPVEINHVDEAVFAIPAHISAGF
ncbi:MAG: hypothetical protein KDE59_14145 [Anaerolineales bacterium]|nr:hypothetical protein [Anaerolineales bacterium]